MAGNSDGFRDRSLTLRGTVDSRFFIGTGNRWVLRSYELPHNNPPQATRWSGHFVFNRQAQRAPERERWTAQ
jgi:hypothetical protein